MTAQIILFRPRSRLRLFTGFERIRTRDLLVDHADGSWSSHPSSPAGPGWEIEDSNHDKTTLWRRAR